MRLSTIPAYKLKRKKRFDDIVNITTSKLLEELSFFDRDARGDLVKLHLETSTEKQIKNKISSLASKLDISILEFPTLQPKEIWEQSKRFEKFKDEIIFSKDGRVLFPTSEEPVIKYFSKSTLSYKELPILLAGFRKLFRAPRTKSIIRLPEFEIFDMYSINENLESIDQTIKNTIKPLFDDIWDAFDLKLVPVSKREGYTDYKFLTEEGDDKTPSGEKCISIGVIMNLCDIYSRLFDFKFSGKDELIQYPYTGSYAIGIERLFYAVVCQNRKVINSMPTITWPRGVEPFTVGLLKIDSSNYEKKIYHDLRRMGIRTLLDDTEDTLGVKVRRLYSIGTPFIIFAGGCEERKDVVGVEETQIGNRYEIKTNEFYNKVKEYEADKI